MVGDKIVNGWWDGQPIWRRKTAGEELADEITKTMKTNMSESTEAQWEDARLSEESGTRYDR